MSNKMMNVVSVIVDNLCTYCGSCLAVCPANAIKKVTVKGALKLSINSDVCTNCGSCSKVCAGAVIDFTDLSSNIDYSEKIDNHEVLGNYTGCYAGHSLDDNLRYNCSSGGFVTSLLLSLLEKKIINGALVVQMNPANPLLAEGFIARTKDEIIGARGSKYSKVPLNEALREIISSNCDEKIAVVALSCQVHGIRKMQKLYKQLQERIIIVIGLFCGQSLTQAGIDKIVNLSGAQTNELEEIKFRGEGWPGLMQIKEKNGKIYRLKYKETFRNFVTGLYTPARCILCPDQSNRLSDISCGDAWDKKFIDKSTEGWNFVISRTAVGNRILKESRNNNHLEEVDIGDIAKSLFFRTQTKYFSNIFLSSYAHLLMQKSPKYTPAPTSKPSLYTLFSLISYTASLLPPSLQKLLIKLLPQKKCRIRYEQ